MKFRLAMLMVLIVGISGCGDDTIQNVLATISGMTPNQLSQGQQGLEAKIQGANFSGATAVSLGDGIAIDHFSVTSANEITVRVSVAANAAPGNRTISVTTASGIGTAANVLSVLNNKAPKAQFSVNPPVGSRATEFELDGGASNDADGNVKSWRWDFADGSSANGKQVKHKWSNLGTFNVSLTVTDNHDATNFATREIEIVSDSPPVAVIKVSPGASGSTLTEFEFDGSDSYDPEGKKIQSWLWDFGDGSRKENGQSVKHKFNKQGNFDVSLSVTDNKGLTGTNERSVAVEKITETRCTGGKQGKHPDLMIEILEANGRQIVIRPKDRPGADCSDVFYRCGDVRQGGITIPNEVWYGTICEMYDRHDGTFRIRLGGGNGPVIPTAPQIYLHSATCHPFYFDQYCG